MGFHHQRVGYVDHLFVSHVVFERDGSPYGHAGGVYEDNMYRFLLLCLAACEAPLHVVLPPKGLFVPEEPSTHAKQKERILSLRVAKKPRWGVD